jgi:uncharacterized membrane protein
VNAFRRGPSISRTEVVAVAAIVAVGAALRFFRLTFQSLWFDELFSVVFSRSSLTVGEIIEKYAGDVHPLGYPLMLHGWLRIFGDNDLAARSLSAVWGIAGIAVLWIVARRLAGPRLGLIAGLLTAVNAYHIAYSQEARSYVLVFVFAALSYLALLLFIDAPGWRTSLAYGLVVAVAFHIHYYALVMFFGQMVAAAGVFVLRDRGLRALRFVLIPGSVVALAILPWVGPFLRVAGFDRYWPAVPEPWFFIGYFHGYFGGSLVLSVGSAALLAALPLLLRRRFEDEPADAWASLRIGAAALGVSVAASLAVAYARSVLAVPMLIPRFTLVLLPAILLLIAMAVSRIRPARLRAGVVVAVVALSLADLALGGFYTEPRKEQWREAAAWVLDDPRFDPATDAVLALYAPGFQYYADQRGERIEIEEATLDNLRRVLGGDRTKPPVVWLLLARGAEPQEGFLQELGDSYRRTEGVDLISTRAQRWEARPAPPAPE